MVVFDSSKWLVPVTVVTVVTVGVAGAVVYSLQRAGQSAQSTETPQPSSSSVDSLAAISPRADTSSATPSNSASGATTTATLQTASSSSNKPTACTSIEKLLATFEQQLPTWAQLDCHFATLSRQTLPSFSTHISVDYDALAGARDNLVTTYRNAWAQYETDYGSNIASTNAVGMPPYVGVDGQMISYPMSQANFDLKMRGAAVVYAAAKVTGKRIIFQTFHPPNSLAQKFASAEEFRSWTRDFWLPQKKSEAEIAEKLKSEYYVPFPVEADTFFNPIDQPQLNQLPTSELVSLAQEWINQTRDTVRPLYHGRLLIQLAANYETWPHWLNISVAGFDELAATVLPGCDVGTTETYLTTQFTGYRAIAARAGIPWSVGELGFYEKYFKACDHSKAEFEKELYQTAFRLLDSSEPQPVGLSIDETSPTTDAKQVIIDYFRTHGS